MPHQTVAPYDTTIQDLRAEPVEGESHYRLPSGKRAESRLDRWALRVHSTLADWLRRPYAADQQDSPCRELVVLAGSDYVDTLRECGIFDGMFDQMDWLSDRTEELEATAKPARRTELSAFDGGFERESATWQTDHSGVDVEVTEQAELNVFESVPERLLATRQTSLETDGGEGGQDGSHRNQRVSYRPR